MARREIGRRAPSRKERVQQAWLAQARSGGQGARFQRPRRRKGFSGPALVYTLCLGLLLGWYGPVWVDRIDWSGVNIATPILPAATPAPDVPAPDASPADSLPSDALSADALSADFGFCHSGGGRNCVVDGDTFWFRGEKYRIADIDTPETHGPRCAAEGDLGARATRRLQALMNEGPFTLERGARATDRYGRNLRVVTRAGESLGGMLIAEGLARSWDGSRHPWC